MKKCGKCGSTFSDELSFCNYCGISLVTSRHDEVKSFVKKNITFLVVGIVIVCSVIAYLGFENKRVADAQKAIQDYQLQKYIDEQLLKVNTWDLKIENDWSWEKDGSYIYIRGSVKNVSSKTISYYKLSAEFLDSWGNVIDTDWTNDGDELTPNTTRKFEFMHKYDSSFKNINLEISEVN